MTAGIKRCSPWVSRNWAALLIILSAVLSWDQRMRLRSERATRLARHPHINPARSMGHCIQYDLTGVCCLYGHSITRDTAIRARTQCSGHPARVARRSLSQREQCTAIPAMDRPVSTLLPCPRSVVPSVCRGFLELSGSVAHELSAFSAVGGNQWRA